jgi:hypothetical protein
VKLFLKHPVISDMEFHSYIVMLIVVTFVMKLAANVHPNEPERRAQIVSIPCA